MHTICAKITKTKTSRQDCLIHMRAVTPNPKHYHISTIEITHVPINSNTSSASIPNASSSSLTPKIFNCSSVLNPVSSSLVMVAVSGLSLLFLGNATRGFVDGANAYVVDRRKVAIIDFMIRTYFRCDVGTAVFCVV